MEALSSTRPCQEDGIEEEDNESSDETVAEIPQLVARYSIQLLQQHLVEQALSNAHYAAIVMCADQVLRREVSEKRQTSLDSFML